MGVYYDSKNKKWNIKYEKVDYPVNLKTDYAANIKGAAIMNSENAKENKANALLNEKNNLLNAAYNKVLSLASTTQGGDYVSRRNLIRQIENLDDTTKADLEQSFRDFYKAEKIAPWDISLGAKPPYGDFDPAYYKKQNPGVAAEWQRLVAEDDLDVIGRYDENTYYLQHYTQQGKKLGLRGNPAEELAATNAYVEKRLTDKDIQTIREKNLGVDVSQTRNLLQIPGIKAEYQKALNGDSYWTKLGEKSNLDPQDPNSFLALLRISERPEDKQLAFENNINVDTNVTDLEDAINEAVNAKTTADVTRYGALSQNILQDTIAEMKKANAQETQTALLKGMGVFDEISTVKNEISNMILGDSGLGGIMALAGKSDFGAKVEKSLDNIIGLNNLTTYNWQQWFDKNLKEKYSQDLELGYTKDEAKQTVKVEADFARNFIDTYITPTFNQSKSLNEFVDYVTLDAKKKNPFQVEDTLNAAQLAAELRANQYLDQLKKEGDRYFDSDFYFNPEGDLARQTEYENQKNTVTQDWDLAQSGDEYWKQQAYRFGVDLADKDAFARMHFQLKGQGQGFDGAPDIVNATKVQDQIKNVILPAVKSETLKEGNILSQFLPTGDLAKQITDPTALQLKNLLSTYQEQGVEPTQEKLGITYIPRQVDSVKTTTEKKPETFLYETFKAAGYGGTEDDFYSNFMQDTTKEEQKAIAPTSVTGVTKAPVTTTKDPYAAFSAISKFLGSDPFAQVTTDTSEPDYLNLDFLDMVKQTTKQQSASDLLSSFSSMFK